MLILLGSGVHPFFSVCVIMPLKRKSTKAEDRHCKRVCITVESLLRLHLGLPAQSLDHQYPVLPSEAVAHLKGIAQEQWTASKEDPLSEVSEGSEEEAS